MVGADGVSMAAKRVSAKAGIVTAVTLLLFGVLCVGLCAGGANRLTHAIIKPPCQPPANEEALIAAYAAEPLLIADGPAASPGVSVFRFCEKVGERSHAVGYTEVTHTRPETVWRTAPDLYAAYGSTAEAEGWRYAGGRNDGYVAAIEFCRTIAGALSTLTIAFNSNGNLQHFTQYRQVVSVPADRSCPFQSDIWGPNYPYDR